MDEPDCLALGRDPDAHPRPGAALSKSNGVMEGLARHPGRAGKVFRAAGPVGTVAAVGFDVYDVATAPPAKRVHVAAEAVGGLAGAVAFGAAGDFLGRKAGGSRSGRTGWVDIFTMRPMPI